MSTQILIKRSATSGSVPTTVDIAVGELAVNTADKRLYTNQGGTIVELGTYPSAQAVQGNATVGGTLGVTGATTLTSGTAGTWTVTGTLTVPTPSNSTDAASKGYVDTAVSNILDSAPEALNTLNELAAALGDDANFATTVTNALATKLNLAGGTMTGNITMGTNKVTSTATPSTDDDLTRKGYVDGILGSATAAADSAAAAATSETNAGNSATSAAASATTATTQASAASTSATNASSSATAAAGSATSAANSATSAATSATSAGTSATNADASETAAATSETNAASSATAAAASASAASTSETNAATSATNAATSATAAATSATAAATSETNAATSESNAANSATSASTSAAAAASDASTVASIYDSFDDRYLGVKASAPSVDNDGNALVTGALYFDSSVGAMRVFNGTSFETIQQGLTDSAEAYELPTIRPTLNLDFANSKQLDPRIDFTRSSTATYWDGKTTAKAEENLVTNSEDFTASTWSTSYSSVSANVTTAPDGTSTADKLVENSGAGQKTVQNTTGIFIGVGNYVIGSFYAKAAENTYITCNLSNISQSGNVHTFDLSTGNVTFSQYGAGWTDTSAGTVSVGNGWYRCWIKGKLTSSSAQSVTLGPRLTSGPNDGDWTYTGDGSSGVYIWGAQVEQRSSVTAYTPTTSTPITRYQPVLQTASANQPRFDHDPVTGESKGLLIEEARTNLNPWSENHSTWAYSANITKVGTAISPSGENNAVAVKGNGSAANIYINASVVAQTAGTTYTVSVWAKRLSGTPSTTGNIISAQYFIDGSGTVGRATVPITNLTDSWQRYSVTFTSQYTGSAMGHFFAADTNSESEVIAIWGIQMEAGSFPTSYIPTSGSQVTRARDDVTGSTDGWFNPLEGSIYIESSQINTGTDYNNMFAIYSTTDTANNRLDVGRINNNSYFFGSQISGFNANTDTKVVGAYDLTDGYSSCAGSAVSSNPASDSSTATKRQYYTKFVIGNGYYNREANGTYKKITFYPARLPNATLQAMTEE